MQFGRLHPAASGAPFKRGAKASTQSRSSFSREVPEGRGVLAGVTTDRKLDWHKKGFISQFSFSCQASYLRR